MRTLPSSYSRSAVQNSAILDLSVSRGISYLKLRIAGILPAAVRARRPDASNPAGPSLEAFPYSVCNRKVAFTRASLKIRKILSLVRL